MTLKTVLLAAAVASAFTLKDAVAVYLLAEAPTVEETRKIEAALAVLAGTETGRKMLRELGLPPAATLSGLAERGISFEVSGLDGWAFTAPIPTRAGTAVKIVLRRDMLLSTPAEALAPILVHELVHVKDRRDATAERPTGTHSERRGYVLQIHAVIELDLPAPTNEDAVAAALIRGHRRLRRIYEGLPLPDLAFGPKFAMRTKKVNRDRAQRPGLPALLAHAKLKLEAGERDLGGLDPGEGATAHEKEYYAELELEDMLFRRGLEGPWIRSLESADESAIAKSSPPIRRPQEGRSLPHAASRPRAASAWADATSPGWRFVRAALGARSPWTESADVGAVEEFRNACRLAKTRGGVRNVKPSPARRRRRVEHALPDKVDPKPGPAKEKLRKGFGASD